MSDGMSDDHNKAVEIARKLKDKGVVILCVAIGEGNQIKRFREKLREIASESEYMFNCRASDLNTIKDSLVEVMCNASICKCNLVENYSVYQIWASDQTLIYTIMRLILCFKLIFLHSKRD